MSNFSFKVGVVFFVAEFLANNLKRGVPSMKNALRTTFFRSGWYSDDHAELERIFQALRDPWNFDTSPYERERLQKLAFEIGQLPHGSVLEVGCAEGVFTEMLGRMRGRVVAIDVSPTAVARARERCATATYAVSSLDKFETEERFDCVVCAETVYYISEVANAIEKLSRLGRWCVVSYLERESRRLDGFFESIPGMQIRRYRLGKGLTRRSMVVVVWQNPLEAAGRPIVA